MPKVFEKDEIPEGLRSADITSGSIDAPFNMPVYVDVDGQVRELVGLHGDSLQVTEVVDEDVRTGAHKQKWVNISITFGEHALFIPMSVTEVRALSASLLESADDLEKSVDLSKFYGGAHD